MKLDIVTLQQSLCEDIDCVVLSTIDSTNSYAKRRRFKRDTLVVTTHQTAGKGRFNRAFYSPPNEGVYFSLVLHDLELQAQLNTIIMALAISNVMTDTTIKWPNDILFKNKKIGGILSEGQLFGDHYSKMIIGVGLNLHNTQIPEELDSIMTYYYEDDNYDVNELVSSIVNEFLRLKQIDEVIELYKNKCETLGKLVYVKDIPFIAANISDKGELIVLDANNKPNIISSGEINYEIKQ